MGRSGWNCHPYVWWILAHLVLVCRRFMGIWDGSCLFFVLWFGKRFSDLVISVVGITRGRNCQFRCCYGQIILASPRWRLVTVVQPVSQATRNAQCNTSGSESRSFLRLIVVTKYSVILNLKGTNLFSVSIPRANQGLKLTTQERCLNKRGWLWSRSYSFH